MTKLAEILLTGLVTLFLTIFLPKQVVTLIREIIKFVFNSLFNYWYLILLLIGVSLYFNFRTNYVYLGGNTSLKFNILNLILVLIIIPIVAFIKKFYKKYKPLNIAIYGCYSVKENEYLTIDIDSECLNDQIVGIIKDVSSNIFTYRTNIIKINNILIPKFIPILLGYNGFNKLIKKRVVSKKHLASLHFIRDINKQNVIAIINYNKDDLTNIEPIKNAEKLINNISLDLNLNSSKSIVLSLKIFGLLFGLTIIDLMIESKQLENAHYLLDDIEKLIEELKNEATDISEKQNKNIDEFLMFWLGHVERYKAILLIDQKQFSGAVQHIMKSIKLNPYYPYDNYISLKQDITKKYGIELVPAVNENNKILETGIPDEVNNKVKDNLMGQVKFIKTTFNYEIIKEIILKANSKEIEDLLIYELESLDKKNPFVLYTKCEAIKYIKKGEEKFNAMYVDRFDDCINFLNEILLLDTDFPLIYTKLGTMLIMKGVHFGNDKLIEEGSEKYKKGIHIMTELGFDFSHN
jgi:tetratricopeptide (TPR) repeat protein